MIQDEGKVKITNANDMNIPVNIHIKNEDGKWKLSADNFMPRKNFATYCAYLVIADTREELIELVTKYILPLYTMAVQLLNGMVDGTNDSLYFWAEKGKYDGYSKS